MSDSGLLTLDTNVLVYLIRGRQVGERIAADHSLLERPERPLISVVTVGELEALASKFGWGGPRRGKLRELVSQLVVVNLHQGNIISRYAEIDHYSERLIKPARRMGNNDAWIAATAAATDSTLLTTDTDFDHLAPEKIRLIRMDPGTGKTVRSLA